MAKLRSELGRQEAGQSKALAGCWYRPGTWEAEAGGSLDSKPAWSTEQVPAGATQRNPMSNLLPRIGLAVSLCRVEPANGRKPDPQLASCFPQPKSRSVVYAQGDHVQGILLCLAGGRAKCSPGYILVYTGGAGHGRVNQQLVEDISLGR